MSLLHFGHIPKKQQYKKQQLLINGSLSYRTERRKIDVRYYKTKSNIVVLIYKFYYKKNVYSSESQILMTTKASTFKSNSSLPR
jgi:hypothetical protein